MTRNEERLVSFAAQMLTHLRAAKQAAALIPTLRPPATGAEAVMHEQRVAMINRAIAQGEEALAPYSDG